MSTLAPTHNYNSFFLLQILPYILEGFDLESIG